MKKYLLSLTFISAILAYGEIIPLNKWSLPADTVKNKNNITIVSGKNKNSLLRKLLF